MGSNLLYEKISGDIKLSIDKGSLYPGAKIPSVNELCRNYGVSRITVLRAYKELGDANYIVQQPGKGYFVRSHSLKKSVLNGALGCFVRPLREFGMEDNYFNDINWGIESECCASRINLLRSYSSGILKQYVTNEEWLSEIKRAMLNIAGSVDGFLVDERIPDSLVGEVINETNKPAVIVNRRTSLAIDAVGAADRKGTLDVLEKALHMGYKRFIFCTSGIDNSCFIAQRQAFQEFLKKNNIDESHSGLVEGCSIIPLKESFSAVRNMYDKKSGDEKTLIMTETDSFGRSLIMPFINIGVKPGKDVGILGFGGLGLATNFKPNLSTVDVKPASIGAMAVKVLMKRISSEKYLEPEYYYPDPVFIFGETI